MSFFTASPFDDIFRGWVGRSAARLDRTLLFYSIASGILKIMTGETRRFEVPYGHSTSRRWRGCTLGSTTLISTMYRVARSNGRIWENWLRIWRTKLRFEFDTFVPPCIGWLPSNGRIWDVLERRMEDLNDDLDSFIFGYWRKLRLEFDTFVLSYIGWLDRIQEFVNYEDLDDDLDSFIFRNIYWTIF